MSDTATVTVLFTDVEGSTSLTQRLGDAKARDVLREHERSVRSDPRFQALLKKIGLDK